MPGTLKKLKRAGTRRTQVVWKTRGEGADPRGPGGGQPHAEHETGKPLREKAWRGRVGGRVGAERKVGRKHMAGGGKETSTRQQETEAKKRRALALIISFSLYINKGALLEKRGGGTSLCIQGEANETSDGMTNRRVRIMNHKGRRGFSQCHRSVFCGSKKYDKG